MSFFYHFQHQKDSTAFHAPAAARSSSPLAPVTQDEVGCASDSMHQSGTVRYALRLLLTRWIFLAGSVTFLLALCWRKEVTGTPSGLQASTWMHSITPPFPCHEAEQLTLLLRIYGKTWANHIKSHYLCYALGRWGGIDTSHQTKGRSNVFFMLFAELWINGQMYRNALRQERRMKQMENKKQKKIKSWP